MAPQDRVDWPQVAYDARKSVIDAIPAEWRVQTTYPPGSNVLSAAKDAGFMSEEELQITDFSTDATAILEAIKAKKTTAAAVTVAFCKRAAIAHQHTCCLTDFFLEEALARAKELDEIYEKTGKVVGPLHGTVKEHLDIAGHFTTAGFSAQWRKHRASKHGHLVQILFDAGAVFYCKTNQPQSIMHLECASFWGETVNPYNTALTAGGSSGGESALISFGGSPLGLGSDIGGSLRSPSAACGIWTLKSTTMRVPKAGGIISTPGADSIASTVGPMGRSPRDMQLFFDTIQAARPWMHDYQLVPLPAAPGPIPSAPWRIGIMHHDGIVRPQPPITRALTALATKLKSRPDLFTVVEFKPYKHAEIKELTNELYFVDGGASVRARVNANGEPLLSLTEFAITRPRVRDHTASQLWEMNIERETLRGEYLEHWNSQNVDFVLCPVGPGPAPELGTAKYWAYTSVWNFVDYPAAVLPTGLFADPQLDAGEEYLKAEPLSKEDAENRNNYSPVTFAGAPLSLQLVGRRHADAAVLVAMEEISKQLPLQM
ncbi:amidase [Fistulina hepatica ATCC 64428]|uniref:amidase n=1 Tax=Fistulina hepatica ATCC 64428 TaxID=1128425 RepID=A0A0D6ZZ75_9AGAR|nr:amidase [Fistulina hepatica ATCC 64428]